MSSAQHRFTTLDGMRGVAAVAVMLFHFTRNTSPALFNAADLAVDLFFCLSGFVIAYSYQNRLQSGMPLRAFLLRRIFRLYPMYLVGIVLGAMGLVGRVIEGQTSLTGAQTFAAIALNALYMPYFGSFHTQISNREFPGTLFPTNDPAWSLFFELVINAAFGLWALRRGRSSPSFPAILGGISLALYTMFTGHIGVGWSSSNFLGGFPRTIFGIFAGVYLFHILRALEQRVPSVNPIALLCTLVAMMCYVPHLHHFKTLVWLGDMLILVPALVAFGSQSIARNASIHRAFDYLGWISYPLYCVHVPVMTIYMLVANRSDYGLEGVACCTAASVLVAHMAAKFIDEPVRKYLKAWT